MTADSELQPATVVEHKGIHAALAAAQGELRNPQKSKTAKVQGKTKDGKPYEYKFKYADIGDVLEAVLPVLSKHGLAVSQPTEIIDGAMFVRTRILHTSGESIESVYPVCNLNGEHPKMGAALTYARRYGLTSLIGVSAVEDTDAQGTADVGGGPRKQMTSNEAKKEVDWEAVQKQIDESPSLQQLAKREQQIEDRRGVWPDTYYWKAKERVQARRLDLCDLTFAEANDPDSLSDAFAELEANSGLKYDDLAALHEKHVARLENAL